MKTTKEMLEEHDKHCGCNEVHTKEEELINGCGFQDNDLKSSLCIKGNLCSECRNNLDYYKQGRKDAIDEVKKIRLITFTDCTGEECITISIKDLNKIAKEMKE